MITHIPREIHEMNRKPSKGKKKKRNSSPKYEHENKETFEEQKPVDAYRRSLLSQEPGKKKKEKKNGNSKP